MLTSAQFGRQFGRHFGQEKTFHGERRTGTSALGFLSQGSWGSGDDLAWSRTHTQRAGPTRYSLRKHPFLLALRRWGRFAKRPQRRRARRNGCFRRLDALRSDFYVNKDFTIGRPDDLTTWRQRKCRLNNEFVFFRSLSQLFQLTLSKLM